MEILIKEDTSCYASGVQKKVLGVMSGIDIIANNFFLTGGTALSVFYTQRHKNFCAFGVLKQRP